MSASYKNAENKFKWQILSEEEQIVVCPMEQGLVAKEAELQGESSAKSGGMLSSQAGARTEGPHAPMETYTPLRKNISWNSDQKR